MNGAIRRRGLYSDEKDKVKTYTFHIDTVTNKKHYEFFNSWVAGAHYYVVGTTDARASSKAYINFTIADFGWTGNKQQDSIEWEFNISNVQTEYLKFCFSENPKVGVIDITLTETIYKS